MTVKKKLLFIGALPPPYHGTTLYFKNLLNSSLNDHFHVIHLNISDPRNDLDNFGKLDWNNVTQGIKNIIQLVRLCIKQKPDLVYLCPSQNLAYLRDGIFVILSRLFSKAKIVQHLHGSDFDKFFEKSNFLLKIFINFSQKSVNHTIVLGNSLKKIYKRWQSEYQIHAIPNGVDLNLDPSSKFIKKKTPNLLFLGNLLKFKGIHVLISAIKLVKNNMSCFKLKIAGNWADDPVFQESSDSIQREVEFYIKKYNLEEKIEFLGVVTGVEKENLLIDSDIFVLPSINEGLPLTILEAMAAGNPVIAIDGVGAIPDVVINGKTGILIKEQDSQQLSEAILSLLRDSETRCRMGKNAYKEYRQKYTQKIHVEKMKRLFLKILEGG